MTKLIPCYLRDAMKNFDTLPNSIKRLLEHALDLLDPVEITLFGSRARGTASELADYDISFVIDNNKEREWNRFTADADELPLTLLRVDLVNFNRAQTELQKQIKKEGKIIYERD